MTVETAALSQFDLFGAPMPVAASLRGRRTVRPHPAETELAEYREEVAAALKELRGNVEDAVEDLREALARVEIVDGGGDVDCALEALDEAVTDALNVARRDLGAC